MCAARGSLTLPSPPRGEEKKSKSGPLLSSPQRKEEKKNGGLVLARSALIRQCKAWRKQNLSIVFTNGVFDILHHGHLELLTQAAGNGDRLVVGINTDRSVKRLKGPDRPINSEKDRTALLASLRIVDAVCLFGEDTPLELIKAIRPDVLVKGSDYAVREIVGAVEVKSWGGRVVRAKLKKVYSSSTTIRRISKPKRTVRT